jgi:hypothetical protein
MTAAIVLVGLSVAGLALAAVLLRDEIAIVWTRMRPRRPEQAVRRRERRARREQRRPRRRPLEERLAAPREEQQPEIPAAPPPPRREPKRAPIPDAAVAYEPAAGEVVCQIRWCWVGLRGTAFYAGVTDEDGLTYAIAWSPRFKWRMPFPPSDDLPEARAAWTALVGGLVDTGWEPVPGGTGEPNPAWYGLLLRAQEAVANAQSRVTRSSAPGESRPGAPSQRTLR